MLTCIHQQSGLCPQCQAEYDADPLAWIEYGHHTEGERRWQELQEEMAADREAFWAAQDATPPEAWDEIPF